MLEQAGFPVSGLLATHADWDHVLGRLAFPGAALGCAETSAARLTGAPGDPQRGLRAFDEEHYVERAAPLALGQVQALPVPGHLELGEHELELHPADGHTEDGMAVWAPWAGVLVVRRLPLAGGDPDDQRGRLARRLPGDARAPGAAGRARPTGSCPATAAPVDSARAAALLREDVAYLTDWKLPLARRSAAQKRIDVANRERVGA